jgi:hypothetical protein
MHQQQVRWQETAFVNARCLQAFDSCYDHAVEHQQDEEGCLHLVSPTGRGADSRMIYMFG